MTTFYGYSRCTTCSKGRSWLQESGVQVDRERDLIKTPLTLEEIQQLAEAAGGVDALLSKRSPAYKKYRDQVQSPDQWLQFMTEEPRLIRRPIVQTGNRLFVGFNPQEWDDLMHR